MAQLVNLDEPTFAEIGYIEVYDYDVANDRFNLRWKDDFNSFNDQRWTKGENKTWPGNRTI